MKPADLDLLCFQKKFYVNKDIFCSAEYKTVLHILFSSLFFQNSV